MAAKLPNGAVLSIAAAYGATQAFATITNAANAVATLDDAGTIAAGSVVEITSAWSALDQTVARVSAVAGDAITLDEIDSTDTTNYAAGKGAGSVRLVTDWEQLRQITGLEVSGGDQQYASYSYLEDNQERQIPTTKNAMSWKITMADDPTLAHYPVLKAADKDRKPRALRMELKDGSTIYYNAYVSFSEVPTMGKNNVMEVTGTISLIVDPIRYIA